MKALILVVIATMGVFLISDGQGRAAVLMEQRELNLLGLKRSPYGEIVGAALQEPVHLLSHGGIGHEHVEKKEKESCECGGEHHAGHGSDGHTHESSTLAYAADKPWLARRKIALARLEGKVRQNNNPLGRKKEARAYEKKRIWDLMNLAYEMDPTNHGNYMIYVDLESWQGGFSKILEISENSLAATKGRLNDPNDALTAVLAAEMLLIYRDRDAKKRGVENAQLESDYDFFIEKKKEYAEAFDRAFSEGRLQQFSQEKVDEMITLYGRFNYTTNAYRKYIDEQKVINAE